MKRNMLWKYSDSKKMHWIIGKGEVVKKKGSGLSFLPWPASLLRCRIAIERFWERKIWIGGRLTVQSHRPPPRTVWCLKVLAGIIPSPCRMSVKSTGSVAPPFVRTTYSFACSALLASLARSAALIRSLTCSLTCSRAHRKEVYVYEMNASISYSSSPLCTLTTKNETRVES